jgi:hypothetical protein
MLEVPMPKVLLKCAGVMAFIGELVATGMAQHVGVSGEG